MNLVTAALIVSFGIIGSVMLPWYSQRIRNYSKPLLMVGTIVLLATVLFDLVPEMVEMGGMLSIVLMGTSWVIFSGLHSFKKHDHAHGEEHEHPMSFLVLSMAMHCFASGMLLVTSYAVSERLAFAVFMSLIAHKGFEAVSVASLMIERIRSPRELLRSALLYAGAFPAGVLLTTGVRLALQDAISTESIERAAVIITSVATGSLFGCLVQDFLLPSIRHLRRRTALGVGQSL